MLLRNARGDAVLQSKSSEFCSSAVVVPQSKSTEISDIRKPVRDIRDAT